MKLLPREDMIYPAAAVVVALLLLGGGAIAFEGFASPRSLLDLLRDNAFLGIAAVGATLVILSGGIDLSVGSLIAFTSVAIAWMTEHHNVPPIVAISAALATGGAVGLGMGCLIHIFLLPAFMVTLAGMFFMRSMAFVLTEQSIGVHNMQLLDLAMAGVPMGEGLSISLQAILLIAMYGIAIVIAHRTVFGRNIYALGGDEQSARLMGVPVAATRIGVYAIAGFCSALAGVAATLYKGNGDPAAFIGLELDAIASVVIGGTLLTGGTGYIAGTFAGVMIVGLIQSVINFQGNLSAAWTRILVGALVLGFILLQRVLAYVGRRRLKFGEVPST